MREEVRFHRWIYLQEIHVVARPAGRLARLCRILKVDLPRASPTGGLPTRNDYLDSILGALTAAWMELETFQVEGEGGPEEVVDVAQSIAKDLIQEAEARKLFRSSWESWLLYLQRADRVQGGG